jgi:hypothetical protein
MLNGNGFSARPTDSLLVKQKQMVIQEAEALERSTVSNHPEQASSTVFVGLDDQQLEEMIELEPGALFDFSGPVPIPHES